MATTNTPLPQARRTRSTGLRWLAALGGVVGAAALTMTLSCRAPQRPAAVLPTGTKWTVVSYNINWGSPAPELVIEFLRGSGADLICLQETHPRWEALLTSQMAPQYPHRKFVTAGGAGGLAILSKHPLADVRALPAQAGWFPALLARVATPLGDVQVLNVHLRPPLSERGAPTPSAMYAAPKIHRAEIAGFMAEVASDAPLLIAGDFNEEEGSGAVRDLLKQGFVDALGSFDPEARTWEWPVVSGVAVRRRYDHILFQAPLLCTAAHVGDVRASDHFPVVAVFSRTR